jgi:hypothetical protein
MRASECLPKEGTIYIQVGRDDYIPAPVSPLSDSHKRWGYGVDNQTGKIYALVEPEKEASLERPHNVKIYKSGTHRMCDITVARYSKEKDRPWYLSIAYRVAFHDGEIREVDPDLPCYHARTK